MTRLLASSFALWMLLAPAAALAQDLMGLLDKGPVVLVRNNEKGRFESAMAVIHVAAPVSDVWRIITDFDSYASVMPKLRKAESTPVEDGVVDVTFEVEVPGPNPEYTMRYHLEPEQHRMAARWKKGDLKGTYSRWSLVPYKENETLVYYTNASKNFSSMAQALEDDQQTLTVGVNVTSALAVVKSVKVRAESEEPSTEK